jgi:ribosomal protein L32
MDPKPDRNPVHRLPDWRLTLPMAQAAARCGAKTRAHTPCKAPAMPNGRCRMHGGASTGPRTAEGLQRIVKARTKHGRYSADSRRLADLIRMLKADAKAAIEET